MQRLTYSNNVSKIGAIAFKLLCKKTFYKIVLKVFKIECHEIYKFNLFLIIEY